MKSGALLLWLLCISMAQAGDIKIHDKTEPYDPFAVRDKKREDHQWQEQQRLQQNLELIERLPLNCILVTGPYRYYRCGNLYYRPYPQPRGQSVGTPQRYQRFIPEQQQGLDTQ